MSDFPVESAENGDMAAVMENFQKKNAAMVSRPQVTNTSATAQVSPSGSDSPRHVTKWRKGLRALFLTNTRLASCYVQFQENRGVFYL
jgi:hypothetical protein